MAAKRHKGLLADVSHEAPIGARESFAEGSGIFLRFFAAITSRVFRILSF
jgi:hypothetical protein